MKIYLVLFLIAFSAAAFASDLEGRTTCKKVDGDTPFSWCLTKPQNASNEILYVLHGMGYNERIWIEEADSESLREAWQLNKRIEPWVVAIDFPDEGNPWALEDKLRSVFVNQVISMVEKDVPDKIEKRSVLGYSMNGFSVFQLWFKNPDLFQKFAALCPAVTEPEVKQPGMFEAVFESLARISPFAQPEDKARIWSNHDPMILAKTASPLTKTRPLFLNYDEDDDFGFNSGAERFLKLNQDTKLKVFSIKAKKSGHCENLDYAALARFL